MNAPAWLVARPIAHRGLHDRRAGVAENSASAAAAAIAGRFAIECDVQGSADGEALVFHDHILSRMTDQSGPVRERRSADLTRLRLKGSHDHIQTLSAFLDAVAGRVPVIVEIKSRFDGSLILARRVAAICAGRSHAIALKSFDPVVVEALRDLAPHLPRGIVAASSYDDPEFARLSGQQKWSMANLLHLGRTRPDFLSWNVDDLPLPPAVSARLPVGMPVMTWTVRTPAQRRLASEHADQMVFEGFRPT
jgi:glycerophosphoryl diester phosphodiesterase